ncbi:MAG: hypothetical protein AAF674_08855 [Pseudomonadota bacterium]
MQRCHPAFAATQAPHHAAMGAYRLEILAPAVVEEDYQVVMDSAPRLRGFMGGDWPAGLSLADNRDDLAWHVKEFQANRSFAWVVRQEDGRYQGCLYIFPRFMEDAADVIIWARADNNPETHEAAMADAARKWLVPPLWPAVAYHLHLPGA